MPIPIPEEKADTIGASPILSKYKNEVNGYHFKKK